VLARPLNGAKLLPAIAVLSRRGTVSVANKSWIATTQTVRPAMQSLTARGMRSSEEPLTSGTMSIAPYLE
jgi:hypothetical protein